MIEHYEYLNTEQALRSKKVFTYLDVLQQILLQVNVSKVYKNGNCKQIFKIIF